MMNIDELNAQALFEAMHVALSEGDMARLLNYCDDSITYWCNAGGMRAKPVEIVGKAVLRDYLESVAWVTESVSVVDSFRLHEGRGYARISGFMRHRKSKITLAASYRQVVTFCDRKIVRLEEYHDAAQIVAFWRLLASEAPAFNATPCE